MPLIVTLNVPPASPAAEKMAAESVVHVVGDVPGSSVLQFEVDAIPSAGRIRVGVGRAGRRAVRVPIQLCVDGRETDGDDDERRKDNRCAMFHGSFYPAKSDLRNRLVT